MKKYYLLILILFQTNAFVICMPDLEHCEQNYLFISFLFIKLYYSMIIPIFVVHVNVVIKMNLRLLH